MNKKDYKEFAGLMASLAQNFESECPITKMKLYFNFLSDLTIEQLKSAAQKIINESIYPKFPTIGAIRQATLGSTDEQVVLAWRKTYRAIIIVGSGRSIQFDDPVIHSTIETMGGWEYVCSIKEKELDWKRKEFIETYKALSNTNINHPNYLIGRYENDNSDRGYEWAIEKVVQWPSVKELEGPKVEMPELLPEGIEK